ncbi:MAG: ribonuclease J [Caldilineae bacterium]|nr:MAG: ribonuclease J [Caldilineae bacterium]
MTDTLKVIPLGGLGEVGKNMTLLEYDDQAIMIDCGLMFPGSDMPGVDMVIPDITYLKENPGLLKAIFITHGHEDHIGALPFVLRQVDAPVYATKLTCGFITNRIRRTRGLRPDDITLHTIADGDSISVGPFTVEPFHVSHSIPDAVGMIVHTPLGIVVHTGEYKFDEHPASGLPIDTERLRAVGDRGVLLLLSDSTNAERLGFTPSEQTVIESMDDIFRRAKGRIIVATFASNIYRVQLVADIAMAHNRKVAFVGRSMIDNTRIARDLGYLNIPDDILMPVEKIARLPASQITVICTGTQGERNSALVRMANDEHGQIRIGPGDTVIISATTIPGNEEFVHRTLDNLFRLGADVIYQQLQPVHVSGHASREGQRQMLRLIRPRYFVPIQGEYRMLVLHAQLAKEMGLPPENVLVVENGQTIEFTPQGASLGEVVEAGHVFVDGLGVGDVGSIVLRDRSNLSRDGFVTCVVAIDEQTGELVDGPNIISRGFVYVRDNEVMLDEAAHIVVEALTRHGHAHPDTLSSIIHDTLANFFYAETHRRPMVFPVVLEV